MGLILCAGVLSGCLVTDEIDFPEDQEFPPTILDVPGSEIRIGSILWIDLDRPKNEWDLPVSIRDENVSQILEARHRILREGQMLPMWTSADIVPSGTPIREDYVVKVPFGELERGACHRVELVVSGGFVQRRQPDPMLFDFARIEDDLARASWTIWEGKGDVETTPDAKAVLAESCATIEAFLREDVLGEAMP